MAKCGLVIAAALAVALLGSCAHLAGAVHIDVLSNSVPKREPQQSERYMPSLCSQPTLSAPSSSVHALRPSDISMVSAMGLPVTHRTEVSRIVTQQAELLSMFNPEVTTWTEPSLQHRSLSTQAEELSISLSHHQNTDKEWKLVLLFVPTDSLCACARQPAVEVEAIVQDVEAALQILQKKLSHTYVNVVVWRGNSQQDKSCQCTEDHNDSKQRLHQAILIKSVQESLDHLLVDQRWHSEKDDFTVLLQSVPLLFEPLSDSEESTLSQSNQLAIQLWTNMLQPLRGQAEVEDNDIISIPCPTEEQPFLRTQRNSPSKSQKATSPIDPVMGTELPCTDRSPSPTTPTSVHELRPGDIKVVAAVGDSLTAANGVGAKTDNILLVINEYRGLSWSIGGEENLTTVTTLPNILREFNPSVTGFSLGIGGANTPEAFLNQAVAGAKSGDMTKQVRNLVARMKNDSRIDFQNDWKLITMFIGGNDICDFCRDSIFFSATNVVGRIKEALDLLHKEVPRAIVNLATLLHILPLRELHKETSLGCPTWFVNLVCPCVLKPREGTIELQSVQHVNRAYQRTMKELVDTGRYDTHDNFTVVFQPFLREIFLPTSENGLPDRSFFSPDCFHLSQKAHTLMARALWNNMLEPVGNKTSSQDFMNGIDLKCPSATNPFFRTARNSNYTFPGPPPTSPPVTNWGSEFSCVNTAPSDSVPTSVHELRPGDIKVIGALGDSLTTGFGAKAKNLMQLRTEYRGVSWSIGGDKTLKTVTTLPNILKKFNPNLRGMSIGQGKKQTGFNMAVSGAKISGIPGQVRRLIDAMRNSSAVDFENDWKLVTLFIGGNDLCQYCNDRAMFSPKNYKRHMMESLDMLYNEVPRVVVNIMTILEIKGLRRVKKDSLGCNVLQQFVCPCFLQPGEDSPELAEVKRINREFQIETENLVYGGRYDGKETFAVILQPFFQNSIVPLDSTGKPDVSFFSVDCFHFSDRGHADMAVALWNNMLEPVGKKQNYNNFTNERNRIKCPTEEHPYIFTRVNSFPSPPTTQAPTTTSTPLNPICSDNVPIWVAAVLAVVGLLIGWGVTWLFLSCSEKRKKNKLQNVVEMKGTGF